MFGWFKKQRNRQAAGKGISKKQMRAGSKIGPNPMAERIKELEAEGYTYRGTLDVKGMEGTIIMERDPTKEKS
jgi:hypothetical protein